MRVERVIDLLGWFGRKLLVIHVVGLRLNILIRWYSRQELSSTIDCCLIEILIAVLAHWINRAMIG